MDIIRLQIFTICVIKLFILFKSNIELSYFIFVADNLFFLSTKLFSCKKSDYVHKRDIRGVNQTSLGRILKRASRLNLDGIRTTIATYLHTCLSGNVAVA